jgi:hypothetical protein
MKKKELQRHLYTHIEYTNIHRKGYKCNNSKSWIDFRYLLKPFYIENEKEVIMTACTYRHMFTNTKMYK